MLRVAASAKLIIMLASRRRPRSITSMLRLDAWLWCCRSRLGFLLNSTRSKPPTKALALTAVCVSVMSLHAGATFSQTSSTLTHAASSTWSSDVDFELGSPTAQVVVEEYFSDTCPHCAEFALKTFPDIRAKYIDTGLVRFVLKELPTPPLRLSALGFIIARCGGRNGYLDTLDKIFQNQDILERSMNLRQAALWIGRQAGLSEAQTQSCIDDEGAYAALDSKITDAINRGVSGTPTFIVNGLLLKQGRLPDGGLYDGGALSKAQFTALFQSVRRRLHRFKAAP